ncbi:MAG: thioredoxin [Eggerthellaceae bacterium]|nr:thioredoxin [Eggerthellaceae bacterium]
MTEIINLMNFEEKVLDAEEPVLVDFFATWCGPCVKMAPVIDEIAVEMEGKARVFKIDIDEDPDLAGRYGISSIPTFIVFKNGSPVAKTLGAQPKQGILDLFSL